MTEIEPTTRQRDVLRLIYRFAVLLGHSPTYRDLRDALGVVSNNAVNDHLVALEHKGLIVKRHGECRGLLITEQGMNALEYLSVQRRLDDLVRRVALLEQPGAGNVGGRV